MYVKGNTIYELDGENRITHIEGGWDEFLKRNSSCDKSYGSIEQKSVIGKRLEAFIDDDITRMLIKSIIESVRYTKAIKTMTYRCDSHDTKRFMLMRVEPTTGSGLRLAHTFLKAEPLDPPLKIEPASDESEKFNIRCSICNRVEVERTWLEPDEFSRFSGRSHIKVNYTVCPICMDAI